KKIIIPKTVKKINKIHTYSTGKLKSFKVHKDNKYYSSIDGVLYDKNVTKLLSYPNKKEGTLIVPKTVKSIEKHAFPEDAYVSAVQLPFGLETIKKKAFFGCYDLKEINIPSTVKTIEPYAFCDTGLESVEIPAGVKTLGKYSFGCHTDESTRTHYHSKFTIYSTKGSTAYKFAKKHNLTFKAIK
ncbi:MAG: leucine-rich repeat domain-containing protein, partial [Ruminococcus sp.]